MQALQQYRRNCADLLFQAYLPFPLLLSQLVTILVYIHLLVTVISEQDTNDPDQPRFFFPFFTTIETVVFLGALRIGQVIHACMRTCNTHIMTYTHT
jgi:hypothetical protein